METGPADLWTGISDSWWPATRLLCLQRSHLTQVISPGGVVITPTRGLALEVLQASTQPVKGLAVHSWPVAPASCKVGE